MTQTGGKRNRERTGRQTEERERRETVAGVGGRREREIHLLFS